jgi:hypothetical protein
MARQARKRKKAVKAIEKAVRKAVKKGVTGEIVETAVERAMRKVSRRLVDSKKSKTDSGKKDDKADSRERKLMPAKTG